MEFVGKISGIGYEGGKHRIVFTASCSSAQLEELDRLKSSGDLKILVGRHHERRSLDANACAWAVMSKIAEASGTSRNEVYEEMLRRYAPFYQDENGYVVCCMRGNELPAGHWRHVKSQFGMHTYMLLKGTSQYDSAEMASFLERVVEEAEELGIDTGMRAGK